MAGQNDCIPYSDSGLKELHTARERLLPSATRGHRPGSAEHDQMEKSRICLRVSARGSVVAVLILFFPVIAPAHGVVGSRMFIEPLVAEDANVKNEINLPQAEFLRLPDGTTRSVAASIEKVLYPGRLSVVGEVGRLARSGPRASGWDNLEIGVKWEAWINERHETAVSGAIFGVLPTASPSVAPPDTAVRPTILAAKGFGDLEVGWMRPLALQGDVGYERSIRGSGGQMAYDAVLMYSLPYLNHWVRQADTGRATDESLRTGLSWRSLWGNLFPFVEINARRPTGTVEGDASTVLRSGACWMGKYLQVTIAADTNLAVPPGRPRHGLSVLADWFLDEILPGFGKTPFGRHQQE